MNLLTFSGFILAGGALAATASAAPIELTPGELGSGKIFTSCVFDEQAQSCLFDSGSASSSVVDTGAFSAYPSLGMATQTGASGIPEQCDWILLQKIATADMTLPQHQVVRCKGASPGNVVGIDLFQGKTLHLDFKSLSLEASDLPIPTSLSRNHFSFAPAGLILLPVTIKGSAQQAVWDTGAVLSAVDQSFAQAHPETFSFVQEVPGGTDAAGHPVTASLYTVESLTVGSKTLENISVLGFDFAPSRNGGIGDGANLILGYNVITQAGWYIDPRTRSRSIY